MIFLSYVKNALFLRSVEYPTARFQALVVAYHLPAKFQPGNGKLSYVTVTQPSQQLPAPRRSRLRRAALAPCRAVSRNGLPGRIRIRLPEAASYCTVQWRSNRAMQRRARGKRRNTGTRAIIYTRGIMYAPLPVLAHVRCARWWMSVTDDGWVRRYNFSRANASALVLYPCAACIQNRVVRTANVLFMDLFVVDVLVENPRVLEEVFILRKCKELENRSKNRPK